MGLREAEIRPENLVKEQEKLFMRDVERIMSRKNEFVLVDCPACQSSDYNVQMKKYEMQFVRCSSCNTVYANPRPTEEIVRDYYLNSENYKFWAENIFPLTEKVRREKIFVPRVDNVLAKCSDYKVSTETLLEIGPGFGTFCEEVRDRKVFKKIIPVEPTPELADALRDKGFDVVEKFIEDISEKSFADVIVAFEVLEHMLEPGKFLRIVHNALKPGGLVFLTFPNGQGFDTLFLQEESPAVDVEHLTLFNPDSIQRLLESIGFTRINIETPGILDTDIVKNRLEKKPELQNKDPFITHMLVKNFDRYGQSFQKYLIENKLSGNLMVTAQKKS